VAIRFLLQLGTQRRDRVRVVVQRIAEQEEPALLRAEKEDKPHHHGDRRVVDLAFGHPVEQLPVLFAIRPPERVDEELDCMPHLPTELVGDLLLGVRALAEERLQRVRLGDSEEAPGGKKRREGIQRRAVLEPDARVPGHIRGRAAYGGVHKCPALAVRHQTKANPFGTQQLGHAVERGCCPKPICELLVEGDLRWPDGDE
jgi:hypothetical protein